MHIDVLHGLTADSDTDLLRQMADVAVERGWARAGYAEALVAREGAFPTGLRFEAVGVAIPHADREWTLQPGVLAAFLAQPVPFRSMEDPETSVPVSQVYLMLIERPEDHLALLQQLVDLLQNGALADLGEGMTPDRLRDLLAKEVKDDG